MIEEPFTIPSVSLPIIKGFDHTDVGIGGRDDRRYKPEIRFFRSRPSESCTVGSNWIEVSHYQLPCSGTDFPNGCAGLSLYSLEEFSISIAEISYWVGLIGITDCYHH